MRCSQCGTELLAPERSEYWSDRHACHVWLCPKCNICFESLVSFPPEPMRDVAAENIISPPLFSPPLISSIFAKLTAHEFDLMRIKDRTVTKESCCFKIG